MVPLSGDDVFIYKIYCYCYNVKEQVKRHGWGGVKELNQPPQKAPQPPSLISFLVCCCYLHSFTRFCQHLFVFPGSRCRTLTIECECVCVCVVIAQHSRTTHSAPLRPLRTGPARTGGPARPPGTPPRFRRRSRLCFSPSAVISPKSGAATSFDPPGYWTVREGEGPQLGDAAGGRRANGVQNGGGDGGGRHEWRREESWIRNPERQLAGRRH